MNSCPPWLFWACSAAGLLGASAQLAPGWDYGLWRGPTWDTGLVGYYTFDGDVHDSGSLGTGAEVATAAEFTTDARCPGGMALVLSNTSTGFVHNKASGFPLGGTPMSMSMWVKTEDEGTSDLVMLGTWEGMKGYMIEVNDGFNSLYIRYGIPQIWVGDSSHDWQHILITYTGTHYEGYSSTQNYSYETTPYYTDVPLVLTVGSNEAGVGTHYIDDLKFYDRVVTLEESAPCSFATAAPPTIVPTPAPPTSVPSNAPDTNVPPTIPPTIAPDTNAPPTDPPATNAPLTNPPATNAPPTDAPATNAPPTNPPATNAPPTDPPATNAPLTNPPATNAPPTDPPATNAPPTNPPATNAPATDPPATNAPPTDSPATNAPPTDPPASNAPPTDPPVTNAPPTDPPATNAPPTDPPATNSPPTNPPATSSPTDSPATNVPSTDPPATDSPPTDPPATSAPPTNPPNTNAPPTDPPATNGPPTDSPATNAPPTDPPATDSPPTDPPVTSAPPTNPPNTNAPPTDPLATNAPPTDSPATFAPSSHPPATNAPPTNPPATNASPTSPPVTSVPIPIPSSTQAPDTNAPQTTPPTTQTPDTDAPPTNPPSTHAPNTNAPPTSPPATNAPPTSLPVTSVPIPIPSSTQAPDTNAPQTTPPTTQAPDTKAPSTNPPSTRAPNTNAPPTGPLHTSSPPTNPPIANAPPTNAPSTQAPNTNAPPTNPPSTAATFAPADTLAPPQTSPPEVPQTDPPPTQASDTNGPLPGVGFPATLGPDTHAPGIDAVLRTGSPPTESPSGGGGLFSKELGSAGTAAGAGVVAGAAGLVTFGSAYAAARISLVTRACSRHFGMSAGEEENVYPRAMHPLQATVVDSHDLGAVMYNSLIALGLFFLFIVVVSLAKDLNLLPTTARDPHGYLSFPSIPLFVWQFLYLGTTFGAARLVFSPSFAQSEFVGGPVLAVCASLPLLIFLWVRSRCPKHALFEPVVDPDSESEGVGWEREPRVLVWLVGPGEWVSRTAEYDWVNRYGSLTRGLRPGREWWASVECLTSFTLACVLAVEPSDRTACGHVRLVCACIYLARFALDWAMTPFVKGLQTVGQPCMHAIQGVGLTLLAGALYSESTTLFDAGDMVLLVAAVALIILTLLEAVGEVVLFLTGRRHRLRARVIEREKELFVPCSFFDPCTPPDSSNTDESVTSELQGFVSKTVPSPFARLRPKGTSELSLDRTRSRYLADDPLPAPLSVCSSSYFDDSPFAFMSPPLESILSPTARSLSVNNRYSTPSMSMLPPASRVGSRRRGLVLDVRSNDAFDDDTALPVTRKSTVAVRPNPLLKL